MNAVVGPCLRGLTTAVSTFDLNPVQFAVNIMIERSRSLYALSLLGLNLLALSSSSTTAGMREGLPTRSQPVANCASIGKAENEGALHPFHLSNAEVEWNDDAKSLEIALKVWPIDLEEALENETKRSLDLDKTEDIDELIVAYLQSHFVFRQEDGTAAGIEWLGKEVSVKSAWLYFEIPLEQSPEGMVVENTLFFEHLQDQVNLLQYRTGRRRMTLRFAIDKPKQQLDYSQLTYGL